MMTIWTRTKTKRTTRKTKRTRIGSKAALGLLVIGSFLSPAAVPAGYGFFAQKDKRKESVASYALIAGTVFRPPGFALPGAKVVVAPEQEQSSGVKLKKAELVSDARGEWSVRVPPVPAKWTVTVKVNGHRPEQRSVSVEGEQRVDLSIVLEPAQQPKETK